MRLENPCMLTAGENGTLEERTLGYLIPLSLTTNGPMKMELIRPALEKNDVNSLC